jgi:polysaccharide export outer membrane protein
MGFYVATKNDHLSREDEPMRRFVPLAVVFFFVLPSCTAQMYGLSGSQTASRPSKRIDRGGLEYTLGPEDIIEISVWKDESLTKQIVVRPDGKISFPLVGEIRAGGLTVRQLQRQVTRKISEFIPNPTVTVLVLQVNSNKVYVVGKVNKPGEYPTGGRLDVMQALSMAGGLTPFASPRSIVILRRERGVEKKIPFNYNEVIRGKHLEQNIILQRGDVVVVP